ncbi:choline ABC transporter permease subunit [Pararhodobacter zhoushanensis]|uniref:choline ABC transporter permease subunit n=1 Tax=Pararhodobacter zhoushanensis TaxID=2479545 RepID=UPI003CCC4DF1
MEWIKAAGLAVVNAVIWIAVALYDFVIWAVFALVWFVQWLPQRLLGLTDERLPVGDTAERGFDYVQAGAESFFDGLSAVLQAIIDLILAVMLRAPGINWFDGGRRYEPYFDWWTPERHSLLIIAGFVLLAWTLQRNWKVCLLVLIGFVFILDQGYWEQTAESLTLVLTACLVCMGIGVPIGIAVAHRPKLYAWIAPVLDLMQTLPTFVYLIPAIVFFGLGMVPGLIATVIFVVPAPIRLTYLGISSTPPSLLEAAQAFGGTKRQVLWKVELPSAYPQIMAGLNQTIMLSLSMVVIAALVGARGLGVPVVRALNTVNTSLGFESGMVIVVVAIILDRMLRVGKKA